MSYSPLSSSLEAQDEAVELMPSFDEAGVLSYLFFHWTKVFIDLARSRRMFRKVDLPRVPSMSVGPLSGDIQEAYASQRGRRTGYVALLMALLSLVRWRVLRIVLLSVGDALLSLAGPLVVSALLAAVASPEGALNVAGVSLAVGMFALQMTQSLCRLHQWFQAEQTRNHVTVYTQTLVFQQSLRMPSIPKGLSATLHNVDPGRLGGAAYNIPRAPVFVFQLVSNMILLGYLLGPPALGAMVVAVLLIPLNYFSLKVLVGTSAKIMKIQDERVNKLTEVMDGISLVKLYSWEEPMRERIGEVRGREVRLIRFWNYALAGIMVSILIASQMFAIVSFVWYAWAGHILDPSILFPCLMVFDNLRWPVLNMTSLFQEFSDFFVSLRRVSMFLEKPVVVKHDGGGGGGGSTVLSSNEAGASAASLYIRNATFSWPSIDWKELNELEKEERDNNQKEKEEEEEEEGATLGSEGALALEDVTLRIDPGQLIIVAGTVGQGKTALLQAILGELSLDSGQVEMSGSVAYCSQQAWIRSGTVRDNVLFGSSSAADFDEERYQSAIYASALKDDLASFKDGDHTEIGEHGVTLSGGQKARVALARALYSNSDILLLDDPLAAVDAKVARFLFRHAIRETRDRGKIVVLVTHQTQFADQADAVYMVRQGRLSRVDDLKQLQVLEHGGGLSQSSSVVGGGVVVETGEEEEDEGKKKKKMTPLSDEKDDLGTTQVSWATVWFYLSQWGSWWFLAFFVLPLSIGVSVCQSFGIVWISWWSTDALHFSTRDYIMGYVLLGVGTAVVSAVRQVLIAQRSTAASVRIHDTLLSSMLNAPMSFFHATPSGNTVARFSKDMSVIDTSLPDMISDGLLFVSDLLVQFVVLTAMRPISLLFALPTAASNTWLSLTYSSGIGYISRLEASLSSPCYAIFQETLNGLASVRAVQGGVAAVTREHEERVEFLVRASLLRQGSIRWLRQRSDLATSALILCVATTGLFAPASASALVGLSLSVTTGMYGLFNWGLSVKAMLDSQFPNVERIRQFVSIAPERYTEDTETPPPGWPKDGSCVFEHVSMRYKSDGPNVLDDLSFSIGSGERIGIVGRTGAGKSSLISALFRLVEVDGSVVLSGIDNKRVPLHTLRGDALSIISQDPFLFAGSVRSNVDPFSRYSDEQVATALRSVQITLPLGYEVKERGDNLSLGQKQLVCMARALLRKTPILILDEATASVDTETDDVIQRVIRTEFRDRTVLTIAHRLGTIMDSDRIMVLVHGRLGEFGSPKELLNNNPSGLLATLVHATGAENARRLHAVANSGGGGGGGVIENSNNVLPPQPQEVFSVDWMMEAVQRH